MDATQLLNRGVQQLGLAVNETQLQQLQYYVELLQKWNKTYNLTAIDDTQEIISKHILDSLSAAVYLTGKNVIDVGSGAGLPGIPLAIICLDKQFVLLDSNAKKTHFMQQVNIELGLKNIQVVHQRVEQYLPKQIFHTLISRAFANSNEFLDRCESMLQSLDQAGRIIFMLGKQNRLEGLPKRYNVLKTHRVKIPKLEAQRHIVIVEKV